MNRTKIERAGTNRADEDLDGIDRILAAEEELVPTSGFLGGVMERVNEEARMPAPIAFPWKWVMPGLLIAGGTIGWGAVELVRLGAPAVRSASLTLPHLSASIERPLEQVGWVTLALGASLLSWLLARQLAGRSGLL
jgi:hypothetical protein